MSAPRVSVIMPVLDGERFIGEAVESVIDQRYSDWELLIVDDGSTDRSPAIARGYARHLPGKIRVLRSRDHRPRGASAARNRGIRRARGELIALLDADDVWLPDKLAEQVALIDAHPEAGMLYGNTLYWYSWADADVRTAEQPHAPAAGNGPDAAPRGAAPTAAGRRDHMPDLGVPTDAVIEPPALLVRCLRGRAAVPCTCSVLARRALVERVGGFDERFRRVFTDQAFYAKLFAAAPVYVAGRCWDRYRIHPGSSCATAGRTGELRDARTRYLRWVERHVAGGNGNPSAGRRPLVTRAADRRAIRRAARRALWLHRHPRVAGALAATRRGLRRARRRAADAVRRLRPPVASRAPRGAGGGR